jgi:3-oxoacyl-[acyl-carrier protein] reductase
MPPSLEGRVALITGGTHGIGKGIAGVFCRLGARVMLVARDETAGEKAAAELRRAGGESAFCPADVRDRSAVQRAAERTVKHFGQLDVLCANAGVFPSAKIADMTGDQWDDIFAVNVKGTLLSLQACLPFLQASEEGRVVVTSSITGPVTGLPGWSHYGATKAAQLGFVRSAAIELSRFGITVNAILPGNIETEGLADLGKEYRDQMIASIPLKRLGTPEDVGYAAAFLASREAGFITGQTLIVDGGQVLPESLSALAD